MVQRIQSVYLAGTVLIQLLISQFSFLAFTQNNIAYSLTAFGVVDNKGVGVEQDYKQLFIIVLACVFGIVSILLFKNRKLQIKLTKLIGFICIAQLSFAAISFYRLNEANVQSLSIGIGTILIPVCAVLSILARVAIKKDDNLIKSVDRIR